MNKPRFSIGDVITSDNTLLTVKIMAVDSLNSKYKYIFWPGGSNWETGDQPHMDKRFNLDSDWLNSEIRRLLDLPDAFETMARNITARYPAGRPNQRGKKK